MSAMGPVDEGPVDVRIDVDAEGHLTVIVHGSPWQPRSDDTAGVRLGRLDVPWVLDRLLAEQGRPMDVVLHDGGRTFTDLVLPEHLQRGDPSCATAPPGYAPDRRRPPMASDRRTVDTGAVPEPTSPEPTLPRPRGTGWFEAGGYTPGEQVAVAVIVTRLTADDAGSISLILPSALRPLVGDVVAIGEESREVYVNQAGTRMPGTDLVPGALGGAARRARPAGGPDDLNLSFRRPAGSPDLGM